MTNKTHVYYINMINIWYYYGYKAYNLLKFR